jgi:hypothetical protein
MSSVFSLLWKRLASHVVLLNSGLPIVSTNLSEVGFFWRVKYKILLIVVRIFFLPPHYARLTIDNKLIWSDSIRSYTV